MCFSIIITFSTWKYFSLCSVESIIFMCFCFEAPARTPLVADMSTSFYVLKLKSLLSYFCGIYLSAHHKNDDSLLWWRFIVSHKPPDHRHKPCSFTLILTHRSPSEILYLSLFLSSSFAFAFVVFHNCFSHVFCLTLIKKTFCFNHWKTFHFCFMYARRRCWRWRSTKSWRRRPSPRRFPSTLPNKQWPQKHCIE